MGGAVSSGESNDELVDNLKDADYIKNPRVEHVFRAVDRALYYTEPFKSNAYKDLAWKDGNLHLSAPCIYSEVMENLQLDKGMSFLNLGSGTGYLSTMCGLIIGRQGVNHGVELYPEVIDYAREKLIEFLNVSPAIDVFDFCSPKFVNGNCLNQISSRNRYDRIYCGAACPEESIRNITDLLKVGGICVMPINDSLVQITRLSEVKTEKNVLLPVSFATLITPRDGVDKKSVMLPEWGPYSLKEICRSEIRSIIRNNCISPETKRMGLNGGRKKRRRRRQERRRASRLLVVQRRRGAEDAEGGFVAVAYSLGNHSSDDEGDVLEHDEDMPMDYLVENGNINDDDDDSESLPDLETPPDIEPTPEPQPMDIEPPGQNEPSSSSASRGEGGQVRGLINRARVSASQARLSLGATFAGNPGAGLSDGLFGRLREMYRRNGRREQRSSGIRCSTNSPFRSFASTALKNGSSTENGQRQSQSTSTNSSAAAASTSTSTSAKTNNKRGREESSSSATGAEKNEDSCVTDSSIASSPSTAVSSTSEDEDVVKGLENSGPFPPRPRTSHRVSASAESGVVTDSPERREEGEEDNDNGKDGFSSKKKSKKLKTKKTTKEQGNGPKMETENETPVTKLKKNPVSVEMRSRINRMSLPPPVKLYLNFYRPLD